MSLHLEVRWQDDEGRWNTRAERLDVVDGMFYPSTVPDGITVEQAQQLARASSHSPLDRRAYALRIGFSR